MTSRRSKGIVGIFALIIVLTVIFFVFAFYTISHLKKGSSDSLSEISKNLSSDRIAVVKIEGPIMTSDKIIKHLHIAENDEKSKAIILRIDSPGGAVGPTQEIYEEAKRIDKKKPVYASFGTVAASGGYYIGAAARKIFSNAGTLTGSIGVIMQFTDLSELLKWAKVNPITIKAGKYKDVGNPARGLKPEEREYMDELVKGVHQQFIDDILKTRKRQLKGNLEKYAQGQIFSGQDAKEKGLVDEIAGLWEAGRRIHKELKFKGELNLKFIKEKESMNVFEILKDLEQVSSFIKAKIIAPENSVEYRYQGY